MNELGNTSTPVNPTETTVKESKITHQIDTPSQPKVQQAVKQTFENCKLSGETISDELNKRPIVLVGTSSAGKTSIIEGLKKRVEFVENGVDVSGVRILLEFFDSRHPDEMAFMRKLFSPENPGLILDYIIHGDAPAFKEDSTPEERARFPAIAANMKSTYDGYFPPEGPWKIIENIMMDEVLTTAKKGQPVIFDVLQVQGIVDHALFNDPEVKPKIALVYCPFQNLAERVVGRNNEAIKNGNLGDVRPGVFPLEQFSKLFRPKRDAEDRVVQTLTRQQAEEAFDLTFDSGIKFMQEHSPNRLNNRNLEQEKSEKKAQILESLGFAKEDALDTIIELTPRFKGYDILVNTESTKPRNEAIQDSVQQILFK